MIHTITLRFRDGWAEKDGDLIELIANEDLRPNASEVEVKSRDEVLVTLPKSYISHWLKVFHEQEPDNSGMFESLQDRYRILSISSEEV